MTPTELRLEQLKSEIQVRQTSIMVHQIHISSGYYKSRDVTCGGIQLTENELLMDEIRIINRHMDQIRDLHDSIMELDSDEP